MLLRMRWSEGKKMQVFKVLLDLLSQAMQGVCTLTRWSSWLDAGSHDEASLNNQENSGGKTHHLRLVFRSRRLLSCSMQASLYWSAYQCLGGSSQHNRITFDLSPCTLCKPCSN